MNRRFLLTMVILFIPLFFSAQEKAEDQTNSNQKSESALDVKEQDEMNIIYKGEHLLNLGVGMTVPVFMHFYNDKTVGKKGVILSSDHYNPPVGLAGFFDYKFYISGGWALGVEVGGSFLRTTNNSQTLIHFGPKASYTIRRWPVDIPIGFEIGAHVNTLRQTFPGENITSGGIFFKPEIGFTYNINDNWGVGATTSWWIVPEIYLPNATNDLSSQSAFSHIWSFAITASYRFK